MKSVTLLAIIILFYSCKHKNSEALAVSSTPNTESSKSQTQNTSSISNNFKSYWYAGEAEITSFKLEQVRYGEIRTGTAVMVFVTEPFNSDLQVKADYSNDTNIPVLKLNSTKNFNTGIYPYSIMQSTFYPVSNTNHALKVSCSIQEWCGHVYAQLNNRSNFEYESHSYFQSEADENIELDKTILENELWNQLRIDPTSLPTGNIVAIPSLEFIKLKHAKLKAYNAKATLTSNVYTLYYPKLNRTLSIEFNNSFPFEILGWTESFKSGYGTNAKVLTSKATKLKTIKSAYWEKNSNTDEALRKVLSLE